MKYRDIPHGTIVRDGTDYFEVSRNENNFWLSSMGDECGTKVPEDAEPDEVFGTFEEMAAVWREHKENCES